MKQDENVHLAVQKQKQEYSCMKYSYTLHLGGGKHLRRTKKLAKSCPTDPKVAYFLFRALSFWTKDVVKI